MASRTSDYIRETCSTVFAEIERMQFKYYLDDLSKVIFNEFDVIKVLRQIAIDAGEIAQRHGATAVRDAMRDALQERDDKIDDLVYEKVALQDRIAELEYELEQARNEFAEARAA